MDKYLLEEEPSLLREIVFSELSLRFLDLASFGMRSRFNRDTDFPRSEEGKSHPEFMILGAGDGGGVS